MTAELRPPLTQLRCSVLQQQH